MNTPSHPDPQAALDRQRLDAQHVPPQLPRKRTFGVLLLALLIVAGLWPAAAQVTFTRVTEGDLATDLGHFIVGAWGDYDGDGFVDLFVTGKPNSPSRLYHNNGDGTFSRITTGALGTNLPFGAGAAWADYDNDGDLDLFLATQGIEFSNRFYRNDGDGVFTQVTEGAWVNDLPSACMGVAWGDYDNDGFLDLFVSNTWDLPNFLYRNCGDGTMTPISGIITVTGGGVSHGGTWADYDNDGDLDLFVSGQVNMMFRNNGDGSFTLITTGAPVTAGIPDIVVVAGDYDNDGDLDLIVTNAEGNNQLWRNDGPDGFVRVTAVNSSLRSAGSGAAAWGDYDNDGYLDLFIANRQGANNFLFRNNGDGTFTKVTEGAVVNDGGHSWGCAWADIDNDGYLDLFVANGNDPNFTPPPEASSLYRNNGGPNHWLVLRLVGVVSNRSAIGAKVRVLATIGGETFWQMREISGGTWNQNDLRAHFGLGDAGTADTVLIEWPSGVAQVLKNVAANQQLVVEEDPIPRVALSFSEGGGLKTRNFGSLAHAGLLTQPDGSPAYSPKVPTGSWAPPNNRVAMDFGVIADGQGGRAIDCSADLGTLEAFTICGWLNARDLTAGPGGNRILCALTSPDGPGFELVQREDGSLQLGVNQMAVDSPVRSAAGRITADAEAAPDNWVFFAVTYDGTQPIGNAQFTFGSPDQAALPDSDAVDYPRGEVAGCGQLTLGNVSTLMAGREDTGPEGSRVFRGLLDELALFGRVLELEEIQAVQRAPARRAAFTPVWTARREGNDLLLEWDSARPFQVQECSTLHGRWTDVRGSPVVDGFRHTFRRTIAPAGSQRYYRLASE